MKNKYIIYSLSFISLFACKKFVATDSPENMVSAASAFSNDQSANSAVAGIYSRMMQSSGFASGGLSSVTTLCALSADEFRNYSRAANTAQFYSNSLQASNTTLGGTLWNEPYQYIYSAN